MVDETNLKQAIKVAGTLGFPKTYITNLNEKVRALTVAEKLYEVQA